MPKKLDKTSTYKLIHDKKTVFVGSEGECWRWIHANDSFSVSHALKYEGYEIKPLKGGVYKYV